MTVTQNDVVVVLLRWLGNTFLGLGSTLLVVWATTVGTYIGERRPLWGKEYEGKRGKGEMETR